ncbi:MAG: Ig-like domain-containing protein [Acidobacteriota bacterium]
MKGFICRRRNTYVIKGFTCILALLLVISLVAPVLTDDIGTGRAIAASPFTVNHNCTKLSQIPQEWIQKAKTDLHIAYGHTSHGSQLIDGMSGLAAWKGSLYSFDGGGANGALDLRDCPFSGAYDLGNPDYTAWSTATRNYLNGNSTVNVIIWSWCGQADTSADNITSYLYQMNKLESDYPKVKFVYMTGHLVGTGVSGNLNQRNEQIRNYCQANGKILYDFADIESYDPDGNAYLAKMATDGCDYDSNGDGSLDKNWAIDWQNSHTQNVDWYNCGAAHTQPLNANMKAYAAWWLWAKLAGWGQTDSTPPVISSVTASAGNTTSAISWNTNENSNSQVEYGLTTQYGQSSPINSSMVLSHSITLSNLESGKTYNYRVKSTDASGNQGVSGNFTFATSASTVHVTSVTLDKHSMTLNVGDSSAALIATIAPSNAANKNVGWASSNPAVASVTNGVVKGASTGTATIKVTSEDGGFTDSCTVTVSNSGNVAVSGLTLDQDWVSIPITSSPVTVTATVTPSNAANKTVIWKSSNPACATVTDGKVTPVSVGQVLITATTEDGGYTAYCWVTVKGIAVTGVTLDKDTMALKVGEPAGTLIATITPDNAANKNVTWQTNNAYVAKVNNGIVTAIGPGTATISVFSVDGGYKDTCQVSVTRDNPVGGMSLDKHTMTLKIGGPVGILTPSIWPSTAANKNVIWKTSNSDVATVSGGSVTPVGTGTVTITAVTEDGGFQDTCVVTVVQDILVKSVALNQHVLNLKVGGPNVTLTAAISPSNAANKSVTWKSDNESVAVVNNGTVTPKAEGTANITVTTVDGAFTDTCVATVINGVTGITLDQGWLSMPITSAPVKITATVTPSSATNKKVIWQSSNPACATVADGTITPVGVGQVLITATTEDGGYIAYCWVTVKGIAVTGVTLDKHTMALKVGEPAGTLIAAITPDNAANKNVTWHTNNSYVAKVNNGIVSAVGPGTATITVFSVDGGYKDTCQVSVTKDNPVGGMSLDKHTMTLKIGGPAGILTATVWPTTAANKNIIWKTSNQAIATVSGGSVTPVGTGTATITAVTEDGGFQDTCQVTVVQDIPVKSVTLNQHTLSLKLGGTSAKLTAVISPSNAANKSVTWKSDNESVAVVNNGTVTPKAEGTANITVTTVDGAYTDTCLVSVLNTVTGISLDQYWVSIPVSGSPVKVTASVTPSTATNKKVIWTSSNSSCATVVDGTITPVSAGQVLITATTEDGGYTAYCWVTIK